MIPREAYPYDTPSGAAKSFPSLARVEPEQGPFLPAGTLVVSSPNDLTIPAGWIRIPTETGMAAYRLPVEPRNNDHEQDGA